MEYLTIGLMGCLTSNENMGCMALTYSLLQMLESMKPDKSNRYIIFDIAIEENKVVQICDEVHIDRNRIQVILNGEVDLHNLKKVTKSVLNIKKNICMINAIRSCNFVIDITQGDSFTDIYGLDRFYNLTMIKKIVEKSNIPLILGPQTYGPFDEKKCRSFAKKVIEGASAVISRDYKSKEYLESFCNVDVTVATDLAFGLKFNKIKDNHSKIRVGLNISGLLHSCRTDGSPLKNSLLADYDRYIENLIDYFTSNSVYELHLIPHVGNDANDAFINREGIIIHPAFSSPMSAKTLISQMDIFIGSRMHATIAALSAGIATIPVGYSRKFSGLFENLGYNYLVDLTKLDTKAAIEVTISYIRNYDNLVYDVNSCRKKIDQQYSIIRSELSKILYER